METILCCNGYILNKIYFKDSKIDLIKKELTVEPFSINNNFYNNNKKFKLYIENKKQIAIPKYYGIKKFGKPNINDIEEGLDIELKFNGKLRDYQIEILNIFIPKFKDNYGGLLCVPPGRGKTVMAIWLLTILKKKTLIIVHKDFLVQQWKNRLNEYIPGVKIGIIQQKKIEIENNDVVIGMLQSISMKKYESDTFDDFGLTIIDEVHHCGAEVFSNLFKKVNTKYMCGLTATPNREDKLEKVIYWYIGNILYNESISINPNINVMICNYSIEHKLFGIVMNKRTQNAQISTMITNITNINERSNTIINLIIKLKNEQLKRKILVLSERIEHLQKMKESLDSKTKFTTSFYIGGMKQNKLTEAESAEIIFSTYQMSSEGLDIPTLNTIILATSRKNVEQSVGRILRKQSGYEVQPLIVDIVDNIKQFKNQGNIRKRYYKKITNENNFKVLNNNGEYFIL